MRRQKEHISQLFGLLVRGRLDEFLAGCDEGLVLTAHGSSPVPTTLTKGDIPDWFGSLRALSPASLRSSVEVARVTRDTATVILRHSFGRNGVDHHLELANLVVLREGLLAEWSSYPVDLPAYSRAWRTHDAFELASV
jgi:ketosteroid isomerase-like protein